MNHIPEHTHVNSISREERERSGGSAIVLAFLLLCILAPARSDAQVIRASVSVDASRLPVDVQEELAGFGPELERYLMTTRWIDGEWEQEPVDVTVSIGFTESPSDDSYVAQLFFISQRDIFRSPDPSALMRILDESWTFRYSRNQQLQQNTATYDEITSLLDFYVYIALGLDFDTYGYLGGTPMYDKAAAIARRGELETSAGRTIGWDRDASTGGFSRYNLINELTNARYFPIRRFLLDYHYNGLDRLSEYPDRARDSISSYIDDLVLIKDNLVAASTLIRMINDAKHLEFASTFTGWRDPSIWARFLYLDPTHQSVYERARDGR